MLPKLGILAGGGELPSRLVAACKAQGRPVFVIALEGHAAPSAIADTPHVWIRMGEAAKCISILHDNHVRQVVMAGPVRRPTFREMRPDWRTTRFFARLGLKALGDDGLLKAVISELEGEGFEVVGVHSILGDLLAEAGVWGAVKPDDIAQADIEWGKQVGLSLGVLDIGQSVIVQQGIVLGVEAIEGTDALIRRCGELARSGPGGVLVKIAKPGQERRVDLPTIGPETIRTCIAAGLRGIAVEAGAAIVVSRDTVIAEANAAGLFVCGISVDRADAR